MEKSVKELQKIARDIRRDVVEMVFRAGSGHLAGSLSCTDILVGLFFGGIIEKGDRFLLSAGHYCPALYSVLSRLGYFDRKLLWTLRELGSPLQGHPHQGSLPGIELSTGALGQGLSVGVGKALALRFTVHSSRFTDPFVYVLMSDGEQNEGQVWEAAMTAAKYELDNLIAIIDKNEVQSAGMTKEIMPLEDLQEKYQAFGWEAVVVNGHQIGEIIKEITRLRRSAAEALERKWQGYGGQGGKPTASALRRQRLRRRATEAPLKAGRRPKVVIAKTVAGKGVSFLEGDFRWHAKPISEAEYKKAMVELTD